VEEKEVESAPCCCFIANAFVFGPHTHTTGHALGHASHRHSSACQQILLTLQGTVAAEGATCTRGHARKKSISLSSVFFFFFNSQTMPTSFAAVKCAACGTFQVQAAKVVPRFTCTMCGEKQQLLAVYASDSKAKAVRETVRALNLGRQGAAYARGEAVAAAAACGGGWAGGEGEAEQEGQPPPPPPPPPPPRSMWDDEEEIEAGGGGGGGDGWGTRWAAFFGGEEAGGASTLPPPSPAASAWHAAVQPAAVPAGARVVTDLPSHAGGWRGGGGGGGQKRQRRGGGGGGGGGGPPCRPSPPPAAAAPPPPPPPVRGAPAPVPLRPRQPVAAAPPPPPASRWGGWCGEEGGAPAPAPPLPSTNTTSRWGAVAPPAAPPNPAWRVVTQLDAPATEEDGGG